MSKVDIVIVNWNAGAQLRECIESIFAHENEALGSVVVVDNASRDGSAEFCRTEPQVTLVEPGRNLGFGTACNLGARKGTNSHILFLNPDTRLLRPTLLNVISAMNKTERNIGAVGVTLTGESGSVSKHCARFPSAATFLNLSIGLSKIFPRIFPPVELVEFDHLHTSTVPHVMGAFYCMHRKEFESLGGFDEDFFVYYEDLDLSFRMKKAGLKILYLSTESIFHRTGGTSGGARAKALSYLLESRLIYASKHFSSVGYAVVLFSVLVLEPARRIPQAIFSGSPQMILEVIKAQSRLWAILRGRSLDRS